jgi:hypothetical protein
MKAIIVGGVGKTSAAIKGIITTAPIPTVCTSMESGIVYHDFVPTETEGCTTSLNM